LRKERISSIHNKTETKMKQFEVRIKSPTPFMDPYSRTMSSMKLGLSNNDPMNATLNSSPEGGSPHKLRPVAERVEAARLQAQRLLED
jgi:hypothetical protein